LSEYNLTLPTPGIPVTTASYTGSATGTYTPLSKSGSSSLKTEEVGIKIIFSIVVILGMLVFCT
jgi:hypothetical protein